MPVADKNKSTTSRGRVGEDKVNIIFLRRSRSSTRSFPLQCNGVCASRISNPAVLTQIPSFLSGRLCDAASRSPARDWCSVLMHDFHSLCCCYYGWITLPPLPLAPFLTSIIFCKKEHSSLSLTHTHLTQLQEGTDTKLKTQ